METLNLVPRGEVSVTYTWGSTSVDYQTGSVQKHRNRIKAKKNFTFTVSGTKEKMDYLLSTYDKYKGLYDRFIFEYDDVKDICTFSEKIQVIEKRELKKIVGFECEIKIAADTQSSSYEYDDDNIFPFTPRGEVSEEVEWNTNVLDMGAPARMTTFTIPRRKFVFKVSGLKKDRQKLINLYNVYGDFTPIIFKYRGQEFECYFSESLTIVDKREIDKIVGFEAEIELTTFTNPNDGSLKKK